MSLLDWTRHLRKLPHASERHLRRLGRSVSMFTLTWVKLGLLAALMLMAAGGVTAIVEIDFWSLSRFWEWMQSASDGGESNSETVRNVGLVIAAIIALPLAIWRSWVAGRQATAALRQASSAQRQADTAHQELLNARYQQGAEMLGSNTLSVRLGGIYALRRLSEDHPEIYHIEIMRLFCAFARSSTRDAGSPAWQDSRGRDPWEEIDGPQLRQDVQAIVDAIRFRTTRAIDLEKTAGFFLDLSGANLQGANLNGADLSGADLRRTYLKYAVLRNTNLSSAWFDSVLPSPPINGLTQSQLDQACADPDNPPILNGIVDDVTNEYLVWREKSCGD